MHLVDRYDTEYKITYHHCLHKLLTIIVYIKHGEFLPPPELDEIPVCSTDGEIMREETDANPLTIR